MMGSIVGTSAGTPLFGVGAVAGIDNLFNMGPKVLPPKVIQKVEAAFEYWSAIREKMACGRKRDKGEVCVIFL